MFGSAVMAVKMENIVREISFKVFAYKKMLDIAQEAMARDNDCKLYRTSQSDLDQVRFGPSRSCATVYRDLGIFIV